ncbi:cytochrome P450 4C1-like [Melitaea cinxia]|uniref:cytochrome P450 4C1-like n=1 Tax=Melitaea cinxia TaxID=113334 RepID=UPI001E26ED95|nr:cytochrome P450 4C1-like [Melitaea cinxia]
MWSVYLLLIGVALGFWFRWRYKNRRLLEMAKKIPGPPALPLLGNAVKFMCQPEEFVRVLKELMKDYGDVLRFWLAADLNVVVSNPDDIKLLLTNNKTNIKGPQYKYMADVIGHGILSGSGSVWRKHRKIATPNYGKRAIESYNDIFNSEVDSLVHKLNSLCKDQDIDIYKYIVQCTSYTVCQALIGLSKHETLGLPHLQSLIDNTPTLYDIVFDRMTKWYLQINPIFWITKSYQQQEQFKQQINDLSASILKLRMKKLTELDDKLYLMNTTEDSSKNTQLSVIDRFLLSNELDTKELIDETFTIFTSSQEASAKISSFLILMMAYHQTCQEKLYNEIINVLGNDDKPITDDDLKQMPYLEMAFKEVLRLFPIGAMMQRTISEDIAISSYTIPAGASLVVPVYHIHRDPRFWDEPDAFDPERFTPENIKRRPTYCYIPFSLGPMDCLGRYFGAKLIKTIVVKILRRFKATTDKQYKNLRIIISISATSLDGFHVKLTPRKGE